MNLSYLVEIPDFGSVESETEMDGDGNHTAISNTGMKFIEKYRCPWKQHRGFLYSFSYKPETFNNWSSRMSLFDFYNNFCKFSNFIFSWRRLTSLCSRESLARNEFHTSLPMHLTYDHQARFAIWSKMQENISCIFRNCYIYCKNFQIFLYLIFCTWK